MSESADFLSSGYGKAVVLDVAIGFVTREVVIGTAGNISVVWADTGTTEVLPNVPPGRYAWRITKVNTTGTTATGISVYR